LVPEKPIEEEVAKIFAQVLGVSEVGTGDDFFELGGTSLGLLSVVMKMSERFVVPLDSGIVTQGASVGALAKAVKDKQGQTES
jgi:acyl carrier protein